MSKAEITITGVPDELLLEALHAVVSDIKHRGCKEWDSSRVKINDTLFVNWTRNPDPYKNVSPDFLERMKSWKWNAHPVEIAKELIEMGFKDLKDPIEFDSLKYLSPYKSLSLFFGEKSADNITDLYEHL